MKNHTPGPWHENHHRDKSWVIPDSQHKNNTNTCVENDGCSIAQCYGSDARENARLISVAPDLLNLCELALRCLDKDEFPVLRDMLRTVITKATGDIS